MLIGPVEQNVEGDEVGSCQDTEPTAVIFRPGVARVAAPTVMNEEYQGDNYQAKDGGNGGPEPLIARVVRVRKTLRQLRSSPRVSGL